MEYSAEPRPVVAIPSEYDIRESAWAIVRNARDLNASGHARAVAWARGYLGLGDRDEWKRLATSSEHERP